MKKTAEDEASKREGAEAMEAQPGPAAETETAGNPAASAPETGETKAEPGGKADQGTADLGSAADLRSAGEPEARGPTRARRPSPRPSWRAESNHERGNELRPGTYR